MRVCINWRWRNSTYSFFVEWKGWKRSRKWRSKRRDASNLYVVQNSSFSNNPGVALYGSRTRTFENDHFWKAEVHTAPQQQHVQLFAQQKQSGLIRERRTERHGEFQNSQDNTIPGKELQFPPRLLYSTYPNFVFSGTLQMDPSA